MNVIIYNHYLIKWTIRIRLPSKYFIKIINFMVNSKWIRVIVSGRGLKDYKDTTFFQDINQSQIIAVLRLKEVRFESLSSRVFTNAH